MAEGGGENIITRLLVGLGFHFEDRELSEFQQRVVDAHEVVLGFTEVLGLAAAALGGFLMETTESAAKLEEFAELNGMAAEQVEAMDRAAVLNKGSVEGMRQSLQGLNTLLGQAEAGVGRGKMIFEKLGLSAGVASGQIKNSTDVLEALSRKIQGMSNAEALGVLKMARVDPSLLFMLREGPEAFAKIRAEAERTNPLTNEDYKRALEVNEKLIRSKLQMEDYVKLIGARLLPLFDHLLDRFSEWTRLHGDAVSDALTNALKRLSEVLGIVWDWIDRLIHWASDLFDWFQRHTWAARILEVALGALIAIRVGSWFIELASAVWKAVAAFEFMEIVALLGPLLIGLLVIAIGLLIDDLINLSEGHKSLIGDMMNSNTKFGQSLRVLATGVHNIISFYVELAKMIAAYLREFASWVDLVGDQISNAFYRMVKAVKNFIMEQFNAAGEIIDRIVGKISGAINSVREFLGITDKNGNFTVGGGLGAPALPGVMGPSQVLGGSSYSGGSSRSVVNSGNTTNTTTITVPGSGDPNATARAIGDELDRRQRTSARNGQTAVGL